MSLIKNKADLSYTKTLALAFVWAYAASVDTTKRRIDLRLAEAKLQGMYVAANAVGYGHTEFHVNLTVHEYMRDRPMPAWQATGVNHARDTWELESMEGLAFELTKIYGR